MVSKERLAILYQETDDKISKEKIFKEIYSKQSRNAYSKKNNRRGPCPRYGNYRGLRRQRAQGDRKIKGGF